MKQRSHIDIIADMLKACQGSAAKKTTLLYGCFLSYTQLVKYLNFLENNGLLEKDKKTKTYLLTKKGRDYIETYDKLVNIVPEKMTDNKVLSSVINRNNNNNNKKS